MERASSLFSIGARAGVERSLSLSPLLSQVGPFLTACRAEAAGRVVDRSDGRPGREKACSTVEGGT